MEEQTKTVLSVEEAEQRLCLACLKLNAAEAGLEHAKDELARLSESCSIARLRVNALLSMHTNSVLHFGGQSDVFGVCVKGGVHLIGHLDDLRPLWGQTPDAIRPKLIDAERALADAEHARGLGTEYLAKCEAALDAAEKGMTSARLDLRNAVRRQANLKPTQTPTSLQPQSESKGIQTADDLTDVIMSIAQEFAIGCFPRPAA